MMPPARFTEYASGMNQGNSLATPNLTPTTPGTSSTPGNDSLLNSLGALNLGAFEAATHAQPRNTPGAIGSQRPGAVNSRNGAPERQPRGPEWEASAGFGGRTRTNGHMQRGSEDSSDNGARSTASRYH
ncbi:hypothetical protein BN1708_012641 [Verticillium longisporum]|nr:hypothetical protein BN1708_012641 [Verticillium longisporum]